MNAESITRGETAAARNSRDLTAPRPAMRSREMFIPVVRRYRVAPARHTDATASGESASFDRGSYRTHSAYLESFGAEDRRAAVSTGLRVPLFSGGVERREH